MAMNTRVTLLTPRGPGAIAVLELQGLAAREILGKLAPGTIPTPADAVRRARFAHRGSPIDDGLIIATAEDVFELHLHGGPAVVAAMCEALVDLGCPVTVEPPAPATLEDEVAAVLPRALTETGVRLLANQPAALRAWRDRVFPLAESGSWKLASHIQWLLQRSAALERLLAPARVAIIGPPNAGKSTLANALLGRPMAITSDIPGTTRDWVDATTTFVLETARGRVDAPITLVDTAGIRPTPDPIERESIRRTHDQLHTADVAIVVFDVSTPIDMTLLAALPAGLPTVIALNKTDLAPPPTTPVSMPAIAVSALGHQNLAALMAAVLEQLDLVEIRDDEPFAFTPRIRDLLDRASLALTAAEARDLLALV